MVKMLGARVKVEIDRSDDSLSDEEELSSDDSKSPFTKKRRLQEAEPEPKLSISNSSDDKKRFTSDGSSVNSDGSENSATENKQLKNYNNKVAGENEKNRNSDTADSSANLGWADAMAKVLKSSNKKHLILAKAKKDKDIKANDIKKPKNNIEVVNTKGEAVKEKVDKSNDNECEKLQKKLLLEKKEKKLVWRNMARTKPHITDKEKERMLIRAATRGVVQLFNGVQQHQKALGEKLKTAGNSEVKKEKVLKSFTKGKFLDILKGEKRSIELNKSDTATEDKKTWDVLREDFMMGAKLKDWDKESEEEDE